MLFAAVELDRRICRNLSVQAALGQLKSTPDRFDPEILAALDGYAPASADFHHKALPIKQLLVGMVLEEDVRSESSGMTIFRRETTLTDTWLERLGNFAKSHGVKEPIRVRVPGPASPPVFRGPSKPTNLEKTENLK